MTYIIYNQTNSDKTLGNPITCLNIMILQCCQTKQKCFINLSRQMQGVCQWLEYAKPLRQKGKEDLVLPVVARVGTWSGTDVINHKNIEF